MCVCRCVCVYSTFVWLSYSSLVSMCVCKCVRVHLYPVGAPTSMYVQVVGACVRHTYVCVCMCACVCCVRRTFVCAYVYVCMCMCVRVVRVCVCVYSPNFCVVTIFFGLGVCLQMCMCTFVACESTYECMYVRVHACVCVCVYAIAACGSTCVYVYVCTSLRYWCETYNERTFVYTSYLCVVTISIDCVYLLPARAPMTMCMCIY